MRPLIVKIKAKIAFEIKDEPMAIIDFSNLACFKDLDFGPISFEYVLWEILSVPRKAYSVPDIVFDNILEMFKEFPDDVESSLINDRIFLGKLYGNISELDYHAKKILEDNLGKFKDSYVIYQELSKYHGLFIPSEHLYEFLRPSKE